MAEIIWSDDALDDLEKVYDFIARDSQLFARHQIESIHNAVGRLLRFPKSGRHIPEFPELPHREIIIGSYRVIYRYDSVKKVVIVVSVVHGRRLLKKLFNK